MSKKPVMLMILDGFGLTEIERGNAIKAANKTNLDRLFSTCPNTILHCSGLDVGLPEGQMSGSEVGHMNIGAGRVVYQTLPRISKSIVDGEFYQKEEFLDAIKNCKKNNSALHLMGLLSDGGIHSYNTHLYALLELAKQQDLKEVYVHCFMDGRDVSPTSGIGYVKNLIEKMNAIGVGSIATISGRYYAMDRDGIWDRIEKSYNAMVLGEGELCDSAVVAVEKSYNADITDEFIVPTVMTIDGNPIGAINKNDSIIFYNFRPDRARQITRTLVDPNFTGFNRKKGYFPLHYVCMTQYDADMPNVSIAFKPESLANNLGEYLSNKGLKQFRTAETQKYAHVTFFFNGGKEEPYEGEDRLLVPSPKVDTFDEKPEMSAFEVTEEVLKVIGTGKYDFMLMNYANCDMVGHTGNFDAAVKAVEAVDKCVGEVVEAVLKQNGIVLITADHGNAEQMIDYETGDIFTPHTTNVVPFILVGMDAKLDKGRLANIAPTILDIMGIEKPTEMTAESLILRNN